MKNAPNCAPFLAVLITRRVERASEQQRKQDFNRREYEFSVEFIAFFQNALHLTRVYCATFTRVVSCFVQQLTGKTENMKIGILKEGFGLKNSEADVDRTVREAA